MTEPLFNYLRLYRNISPEDHLVINRHLQCRSVPEGETLLREGKIARELFFISKGVLKIVSTNAKGNDVTQFFLKENHFCTIVHSFNYEEPAGESIVAACEADLIVFNRERLWELYKVLPWFRQLIDSITQQTLLEKIKTRNAYMGEEAAVRYQRFITMQPELALRVSLTDIASYLGITPQSLSRIRRKMRP
jgi:CRP-like cAMP-binding protein